MTISQRVFFLLEKQGKKQNELSKFTGISTSTISAWNKRGTNPAADTISTIADFFGVSTDFLLTGEENQSKALNDDEQELLENYKKLSPEDKEEVSTKAKELANGTAKEKTKIFEHAKSTDLREREMLMLFRSLSEHEQERLIGRAELLVEQAKFEESAG